MKAVLVVNVPKEMINGKYTYTLSLESKTSNCNNLKGKAILRQLPKLMEEEDYNEYRCGWNACLGEILGDYITQEEADLCGVQFWHDD